MIARYPSGAALAAMYLRDIDHAIFLQQSDSPDSIPVRWNRSLHKLNVFTECNILNVCKYMVEIE